MSGWWGVVLTIGTVIVWVATGQRDAAVLGLGLMAIVVVAGVQRLRLSGQVAVTVQAPDRSIVPWGQGYAVTVMVQHAQARALQGVELVCAATLPSFPPGAVLTMPPHRPGQWDIVVPCYQRGVYTVGPLTWQVSDVYDQFPLKRQAAHVMPVLVLPQVVPLQRVRFTAAGMLPGDLSVNQRSEIPPTVATVREYQPGDPLARVVWTRQTAQGQPLVRVFAPEVQVPVVIVLDLPADLAPAQAELLISLAASLGSYYSAHGARLGLVIGGAQPQVFAPDYGRGVAHRLLQGLAVARTGQHDVRQLLNRITGVAIAVVITPAPAGHWQAVMAQRRSVRWHVVTTAQEGSWSVPWIAVDPMLGERKAQAEARAMQLSSSAGDQEALTIVQDLQAVAADLRAVLEGPGHGA